MPAILQFTVPKMKHAPWKVTHATLYSVEVRSGPGQIVLRAPGIHFQRLSEMVIDSEGCRNHGLVPASNDAGVIQSKFFDNVSAARPSESGCRMSKEPARRCGLFGKHFSSGQLVDHRLRLLEWCSTNWDYRE